MKGLSRKKRMKAALLSSFFIVLTIPVAIFALVNGSFNIASQAAGDDECQIRFRYVNPDTVARESIVRLELTASIPQQDGYIEEITIQDDLNRNLLTNDYSELEVTSLTEDFVYQSESNGEKFVEGTLTTTSGETYDCGLADRASNTFTVADDNLAPSFETTPSIDSIPSTNLVVGDDYLYELNASDSDGDNIEYNFTFTPDSEWLRVNQIETEADQLRLDFTGTTVEPGSYLANVFIHDGYSDHLTSQSWVISVSQAENDIPEVTINSPLADSTVVQGDILDIEWEATDQNQILTYRIYYASNPANESTWVLISELGPDFGRYRFDTDDIEPGEYVIIVEAIDNQDPVGIGNQISPEFTVEENDFIPDPNEGSDGDDDGSDDDDKKPDDQIILDEPQIASLSPGDGATVGRLRPSISATLIAGEEATVDQDSIIFELNDEDISNDITISEISNSEISVSYQVDEDLEAGENRVRVEFTDSNDNSAQRSWVFDIEIEDDNDDYEIFGFTIPRNIAIIILIGLGILIAALLIPWVLYLAWRDSDDEYDVYESGNTYSSGDGDNNNWSNSSSSTYTERSPRSKNEYSSTNTTPPSTSNSTNTSITKTQTTQTPKLVPRSSTTQVEQETKQKNSFVQSGNIAPKPLPTPISSNSDNAETKRVTGTEKTKPKIDVLESSEDKKEIMPPNNLSSTYSDKKVDKVSFVTSDEQPPESAEVVYSNTTNPNDSNSNAPSMKSESKAEGVTYPPQAESTKTDNSQIAPIDQVKDEEQNQEVKPTAPITKPEPDVKPKQTDFSNANNSPNDGLSSLENLVNELQGQSDEEEENKKTVQQNSKPVGVQNSATQSQPKPVPQNSEVKPDLKSESPTPKPVPTKTTELDSPQPKPMPKPINNTPKPKLAPKTVDSNNNSDVADKIPNADSSKPASKPKIDIKRSNS